ncbi:MAG: hypothetical protein WA919_09905 [Coleofasciculaceae cyanobacterium]
MTNQRPESLQRKVGILPTQEAVEATSQQLQAVGISPAQISVQNQDQDPLPPESENQAARSAKGGAIAGAIFGGFLGGSVSLIALNLPGNGPLSGLDTTNFTLFAILIGAVVGSLAFGLLAALSGANVPKESATADRESLSRKYRLEVKGSQEEIAQATEILRQQGAKI